MSLDFGASVFHILFVFIYFSWSNLVVADCWDWAITFLKRSAQLSQAELHQTVSVICSQLFYFIIFVFSVVSWRIRNQNQSPFLFEAAWRKISRFDQSALCFIKIMLTVIALNCGFREKKALTCKYIIKNLTT